MTQNQVVNKKQKKWNLVGNIIKDSDAGDLDALYLLLWWNTHYAFNLHKFWGNSKES